MPTPKTQRTLALVGTAGVLASCFGCSLAAANQMAASTVLLVIAWLLLVPLFGYLLRTRRRIKKVLRQQSAQSEQELEALASIGSIVAADEGRKTKDEGSVKRET